MKRLFLALLFSTLVAKTSFADLDYYSTLGTNDRNSGPKVAVALVLSAGVLWAIYWFWGGGKDAHDVASIRYPDRVEKVALR